MNKIEIKNLNKDYHNFALKNVNFSIPEGYVTGFIGRNGMGENDNDQINIMFDSVSRRYFIHTW